MLEDNDVIDETSNVTEQDSETNPEVVDQDATADVVPEIDSIDELKEKLQKQQAQNQRLFERAKKAEGFEKQPDGTWVKVSKKPVEKPVDSVQPPQDSLIDTLAFIDAKVTNKEDVEMVKDYAKFKNISVIEALNSAVVKSTLEDNFEKRQTASATNTGKTRTGKDSVSGESLLAKASKTGEIPDRDEDLDKMLEARYTPKSRN